MWSSSSAGRPGVTGVAEPLIRRYSAESASSAAAFAGSRSATASAPSGCDSNELMVHQVPSGTESRSWLTVRKSPDSRSMGACAPAVAALQAAWRNSRFVSARLTARLATRSGDSTQTAASSGR